MLMTAMHLQLYMLHIDNANCDFIVYFFTVYFCFYRFDKLLLTVLRASGGVRIGVRRWGRASGLEFGGGEVPQDWGSEVGRCLRIGVRRPGGPQDWSSEVRAGSQDWSSEVGRSLRIGVRRWGGASGLEFGGGAGPQDLEF